MADSGQEPGFGFMRAGRITGPQCGFLAQCFHFADVDRLGKYADECPLFITQGRKVRADIDKLMVVARRSELFKTQVHGFVGCPLAQTVKRLQEMQPVRHMHQFEKAHAFDIAQPRQQRCPVATMHGRHKPARIMQCYETWEDIIF